jgi:DNA topoisomerase-1
MSAGAQSAVIRRSALLRDSVAAARAAQLRYVGTDEPGYRRRRRGRGFVFVRPDGTLVKEPRQLARIRALAIPPAWQDVWICMSDSGHIQASGRDARGRKQYRYHARWREVRDEAKYHEIVLFARALPKLRQRMERDLLGTKLTKAKVVATVLRIMEETHFRVGNDCYAAANQSYGLTTLLDRHARISSGKVEFRFRGKGGKPYRTELCDRRLAAIVKRCRDIPGQRLFQYVDESGAYRAITSTDVNSYLRSAMGSAFSAKELRTWAGTVAAALLLGEEPAPRSASAAKRTVARAIEAVASKLGNTPAICRRCYVHPVILDAYADGALRANFAPLLQQAEKRRSGRLRPEEEAVVALLEQLTGLRARPAA